MSFKRFGLLLVLAVACVALTSPPRTDYVSYLGGSYADIAAGLAVDAAGSAYVAGTTNSPDFPLTSLALGTPSKNNSCAFVTKFNPIGTGIVFSICVANSRALAFGLDGSGNMYLALQRSGFIVMKLDPSGQKILYTTPIAALPESMAVDTAGNVYLAGFAGPDFTATPGAYQRQIAAGTCRARAGVQMLQVPCSDAFAMKLGTSGAVSWATFLGGSGPDDAHAIAIDKTGSAWVVGETVSPDFPTTSGAVQTALHGEVDLGPLRYGDAFVAKLDPTGGKLLYSTYLGGSAPDAAFGVAVDSSGAAYVAGSTTSPDFPTTPGTLQPVFIGGGSEMPRLNGDAFVVKFDSTGKLVYSTFIGGPNQIARAIVVDGSGEAFVNAVISSGAALPCTQRPAISVLNATGSAIVATAPVGGYLALDGNGALYSAGQAPLVFFSTPHAFQTQYGGGDSDAAVAKVDFSQPAGPEIFSIVNAASNSLAGNIAPGEIVMFFGNGFGSQPSVLFDGIQAPIIYASNCQINAVVPFAVTGQTTTFVDVEAGETIGLLKLPVAIAAPGIFTSDGTGRGQAAAVNQDGTPNSPSNPAQLGSIISLYMTGTGILNPFLSEGSLGPLSPPFPIPIAGVGARIGTSIASVLFAGQAPGLIAGVTQVNIQIPQNTAIGDSVPVTVYVGNYVSQFAPSVVIAVR
ncbi:MAG: SBBP repeat-containing protein [Bryobacteraceae bacterium]